MRVVPCATFSVVLATLVSQVAVLLAFFLPLKVVILLGSEGIPRYFPRSFAEVDRDFLIVALSVATVIFYGLHLLAERIIRFSADYGTRCLLARSQKTVLFENQNEVAATGYQRYSGALASGVFVLLALVALAFVYPEIALLLLGFIAAVLAVFWAGHRFSPGFRTMLDMRLAVLINTAGAIGFFLAFAYLVADFIFWSPPGLIVAIISLLLSRQVFTRTTGLVSNVAGLSRQRVRLDALFFHGKVLLPVQEKADKSIWSLLTPQRREEWVKAVLDELAGGILGPVTCHWQQTGVLNVVALRVTCSDQDRTYLVKLFDTRRTALALHEATLLAQAPTGLPAPEFLGATQVERFHCHVLALPPGKMAGDKTVKQVAGRVAIRLLKVDPPTELVRRYTRSRPMFWQHLDEDMLERLNLASEAGLREDLRTLSSRLSMLRQLLQDLPLWLVNPNVNADTVYVAEAQGECVLHWGQWSLEPLGAGWPVKDLPALKDALAGATEERLALSSIAPKQVELAALAHEMYKDFKRQRYTNALKIVPRLRKRLT